jgi:hypothetical protein
MAKMRTGYVPKRSPERHSYMTMFGQIFLAYFTLYEILNFFEDSPKSRSAAYKSGSNNENEEPLNVRTKVPHVSLHFGHYIQQNYSLIL